MASADPFSAPTDPSALLEAARAGRLDPCLPILIAGPTASGKSALALALAEVGGRAVVNADAMQVYGGWRILSARPSPADLARAPHALYGHVAPDAAYSVGQWLREVAPMLRQRPAPVIVGGTGLYFSALTEGLADIPETLPETRSAGTALREAEGLAAMAGRLDPDTRVRIDLRNPMRVQRAWEVQVQTGRGLAAWQDGGAAPLLPLAGALPLLLSAPRDWLADRLAARFDAMLASGLLDEARAMLPTWDPAWPASRVIGAAELIAHLQGQIPLEEAREATLLASRQYAKRQRTWFRNRMGAWWSIDAASLCDGSEM